MDYRKTGQHIADCRKKKGMTQRELADKLGITNKAVSKWETGQGMPDVSVLLKLGEVLGVSVESLLAGEDTADSKPEEDKAWLVYKKAQRKIKSIRFTARGVAAGVCFLAAVLLVLMQVWYLLRGRAYQVEYMAGWMFFAVNGLALVFLYLGGLCVKKLCKIFKRKTAVAIAIILFLFNITAGIFLYPSEKEIVSLSPDYQQVMVLKVEEDSGKATLYRNRWFCFVRPADVFPYTVKGDVKRQWLTGDVCTLTYESTEDDRVHQYAATYGDRGQNSYYYVFSAAMGKWAAEGKYTGYWLEVTEGEDAEITINTPDGKEVYGYEECLQYGTLALVFPSEAPRWTLVLNEDCVLEPGESKVKEGGTLTLCRIDMEKTAPIIMY